MALSNYDRIGNALNILRDGVAPFVEREFKSVHSDNWKEAIQQSIHSKSSIDLENGLESADIHFLLSAMWSNWRSVFERTLGRGERSLVSEIREWRNKWAHQEKFSADDVYRAIDSMTRLLFAISAEQAAQLDEMKHEVLRYRFDEQVRKKAKDAALTTVEFNNELKLKPWREIITPHPDVSSGTFQQAEFAADLNQVHNGKASSEYSDPSEFFQRTFITSGLDVLIRNAINRIVGRNGDPVVQLQTNFGGGKTHSMLALYHLFGTQTPSKLSGLEEILKTTEVTKFPKVNRAVFVGTAQSPANQRQKSDGCKIGTIWGEIAWQLGGKDGYSLVRESDEKGVSPGSDTLKELFSKYSPCLILIDEWVAFVRQLYGKDNLPGGSFDANVSFAQSLTEAIKQVPNALLVASIPASDIEIGGDGGREALSRLKHVFARVESTWRPATSEEAFKIVSRRLFEPLRGPDVFKERDAVIAATLNFYL